MPPENGERWISDTEIKGFGLRLWASSNGIGKAYAIRARDRNGKIFRETLDPHSSTLQLLWRLSRSSASDKSASPTLGERVGDARQWAKERLQWKKGGDLAAEGRRAAKARCRAHVESVSFEDVAKHTIHLMKLKGRDENYIHHIKSLKARLSNSTLQSKLATMDVRSVADEITDKDVGSANVGVLRSFVGQVYKFAGNYGYFNQKADAINRRVARNIRQRNEPAYPAILEITEADFLSFFDRLEADVENWRAALAIRFYFATSAKMRPILKARWSSVIDSDWFPYLPEERQYWYDSAQRLDATALRVIEIIRLRHGEEGCRSEYLFPASKDAQCGHLTTIHRYWEKAARISGWDGLPLMHVVWRHKARDRPSYQHSYYNFFLAAGQIAIKDRIVSISDLLARKRYAFSTA